MKNAKQLHFFQNILADLHVSSTLLTDPERTIPSKVDLHLREELFQTDNYCTFLTNSFSAVAAQTVYRFFDEYHCHYIFLKISETENAYFFLGPYLLEMPSKEKIEQLAGGNLEKTEFFVRYYGNLPIVEDENFLLTMTTALGKELWEDGDISLEYVDYAIPDARKPVENSPIGRSAQAQKLDLETLERNYANERILMDAVSSGKLHKLTAVASSVFNQGAEPRLSDSLRDRKNYLVILKTLLRKAAEYGGVHPLHLHRLSSAFAYDIEALRSIKQSRVRRNISPSSAALRPFIIGNLTLFISSPDWYEPVQSRRSAPPALSRSPPHRCPLTYNRYGITPAYLRCIDCQ